MNVIKKVIALPIKDNKFLVVKKVDKDIWVDLGGKPEGNETERETLAREIKEELNCDCIIREKLGDFENDAAFDPGFKVYLAAYITDLVGTPVVSDPEIEKFAYIGSDYKEMDFELAPSIETQIIPALINKGYLKWPK